MNLTKQSLKKLQEAKRYDLIVIAYINESGYAGCMPNGNIVDRRFYPEAVPVAKNSMFGIPGQKQI